MTPGAAAYLQPQLVVVPEPQHDAFSDAAQHERCAAGGRHAAELVGCADALLGVGASAGNSAGCRVGWPCVCVVMINLRIVPFRGPSPRTLTQRDVHVTEKTQGLMPFAESFPVNLAVGGE